jgi:hypothetical protein
MSETSTETTEQAEDVFVSGRGQRTALLLLTAAAQLDLDRHVVRSQRGGYRVPAAVAERYEKLGKDLKDDEDAIEEARQGVREERREAREQAQAEQREAYDPQSLEPAAAATSAVNASEGITSDDTSGDDSGDTPARKTASKRTASKRTARKSTSAQE